jgi:hypothetical protein
VILRWVIYSPLRVFIQRRTAAMQENTYTPVEEWTFEHGALMPRARSNALTPAARQLIIAAIKEDRDTRLYLTVDAWTYRVWTVSEK